MKLAEARLNRLSDIFMDIGQVCLGSVVIPFIISRFSIIGIITGLIFSFAFWTGSILLVKVKKYE